MPTGSQSTTVDTADRLRQLQTDGFCMFDAVIPADKVEAIRDSVVVTTDRMFRENPDDYLGVSHLPGLTAFDQSFSAYVGDPRIIELAETLWGPPIRISNTSATINEAGKPRGKWHADVPFNQNNAGRIPAPYPDACIHLTTLFMLSPFTEANGGTLVVPGSHRSSDNPTSDMGVDPLEPYPTEYLVTGAAGDVVLFDSRLWHSPNVNSSSERRVAIAIRYAPWWFNLDMFRPGPGIREDLVQLSGNGQKGVPLLSQQAFDNLAYSAKPLYRHWVEAGVDTGN